MHIKNRKSIINAASFVVGTQNVDMSLWRDKFESFVTDGGRVLDAGCNDFV